MSARNSFARQIASSSAMARVLPLVMISATLAATSAHAQAGLPSGGHVVTGSASIANTSPNAMSITQGSDRAIINWQAFSVGEGHRVDIHQRNAQSVLLNRVTGNTTSTIAGQINANGQVYLVNPNGIMITRTGSVNAAGFVASSLDIRDDRFMAGDIVVTGRGGHVSNAGAITIVKGGYAALIGGRVDNSGLIAAPLGRVALGAGTRATLDLAGDGFLQVALPNASDGGITMSGRISADGGSVILTSASAVDAARHVVNLTGAIEARSVSGRNGAVTLTGSVIELSGATINVSAQGNGDGGRVRIGGDYQGGGTLVHAQTLSVDAASHINADGAGNGHGGDIVLWSDKATRFAGNISARGAGSGDGGNAEVSSKGLLDYRGHANLTGARFGDLLLDPYNITISTDSDSNQSSFIATGNDSVLNATTLINALATGNVTVLTGSSGTQAGNITLTAPLTWTSITTLTLHAAGAIALNGNVSAAAGGLTLTAGSGQTISATGDISTARFALTSGNWVQNAASLPGFSSKDFRITGGTFLRTLGGDGSSATPWQLTDVYGLQGINGFLTSSFTLANDVDASGTVTWNNGAGWVPLGTDGAGTTIGDHGFNGIFDGAGHVISGLTVNQPTGRRIGFFGYQGGGSITAIGLTGVAMSGTYSVGGLVGMRYGGIISQSYAEGAVTGGNGAFHLGGLVGYQGGGSISQSYASVTVTGGDAAYNIGGLAGTMTGGGSSQSYASGTVTGGDAAYNIGGLAGYQQASIRASYASGTVTGGDAAYNIGGLVGFQDFSIRQSYATGTVTGGVGVSNIGGLVGRQNSFDIFQSYANGTVSAGVGVSNIGGLVGYQVIGSISQSYASGAVIGGGGVSNIGGLVGHQEVGYISQSYASGAVIGGVGVSNIGGLVGFSEAAISQSFWDTQTTGRATSAGTGATGLTTAQMQNLSTFATVYDGWDFTSVWAPPNQIGQNNGATSAYYPQLYALSRIVTVTPDATMVYGSTPIAQYYGLRSGDSITTTATIVGASATSNVGSYDLTASGTAASGDAYRFVHLPQTMTITARPITVTADAASRIYGNANPASGSATGDNLVNGDSITSVSLSTPATVTTGVGSYNLTASNASGTGLDNYVISYATRYFGLMITPRPLTITVDALSRIYGNTNPALTYDVGGLGLVNGDRLLGALATNATTTSGVGSYAINQGTLIANSSYVLSYVGANLTITPRALAITANNMWRIYGTANPVLSYYDVGGLGLVNGDTLSGALTTNAAIASNVGSYAITQGTLAASGNYDLSYVGANLGILRRELTITAHALSRIYGNGNPALTYDVGGLGLVKGDGLSGLLATNATTTSGVGSYAITQGTLAASSNYRLIYVGANLGITPRAMTITAHALSRIYGDANPTSGTGAGDNLINRDSITSVSLSTPATVASGVGSYDLTPSNASGPGLDNYVISYETHTNGLMITPRALTVTADALSRIYGNGNPALTYDVGGLGLVKGDTLSGVLTTNATTTSGVGSYAITQGTLAASGNYELSYVGANRGITQRALTVTADALSRIYGNANPALTYDVGGLGLVNGDTLSGALATNATTTSGVGSYAITQGTLAASGNYDLSYVGANLGITQRALTVTANALSRIYGTANPALTYDVGGLGLVSGDTLSGALATSATIQSPSGLYVISQGTLSAPGNYQLTFTPGSLTITLHHQLSAHLTASSTGRDHFSTRVRAFDTTSIFYPIYAGANAVQNIPPSVSMICFLQSSCPRPMVFLDSL